MSSLVTEMDGHRHGQIMACFVWLALVNMPLGAFLTCFLYIQGENYISQAPSTPYKPHFPDSLASG